MREHEIEAIMEAEGATKCVAESKGPRDAKKWAGQVMVVGEKVSQIVARTEYVHDTETEAVDAAEAIVLQAIEVGTQRAEKQAFEDAGEDIVQLPEGEEPGAEEPEPEPEAEPAPEPKKAKKTKKKTTKKAAKKTSKKK